MSGLWPSVWKYIVDVSEFRYGSENFKVSCEFFSVPFKPACAATRIFRNN